jgi:hypothetical protein
MMNAFELTAQELGITVAEVEWAVKISVVHRKHRKQLRERQRMANAEALNKHELAEAKAKYPNQCFCIEEGLDPKHDWNSDKLIRYDKKRRYTYLGFSTEEFYDDPIYTCSTCGKEWRIRIAIA